MAIKITKAGQKEFHGFCKWCGCEFTYEISDLKLSATGDKLDCPTCGKTYHHNMMIQDPTTPGGIGRLQDISWPPEPIPCTVDKADPCAGCAWKENLMRDGLYVGDTPCTWCNKNRWNSITCDTNGDSLMDAHKMASVTKLDTYLNGVEATPLDSSGIKYQIYGSSCCENSTDARAVDGIVTTTVCGFGDNECKHTELNCHSGEHKCHGKENCKGKH